MYQPVLRADTRPLRGGCVSELRRRLACYRRMSTPERGSPAFLHYNERNMRTLA
jgi:hypothetical protein